MDPIAKSVIENDDACAYCYDESGEFGDAPIEGFDGERYCERHFEATNTVDDDTLAFDYLSVHFDSFTVQLIARRYVLTIPINGYPRQFRGDTLADAWNGFVQDWIADSQ